MLYCVVLTHHVGTGDSGPFPCHPPLFDDVITCTTVDTGHCHAVLTVACCSPIVCEDKEPVLKQLIGPVFQVWAWILSFRVVSGHPVSSWLALTPLPGDTKCVHTRGREDSTQVTMESREVILSVVVVLLKTVSHIAQVDWKSRSLTLYILCLK